MILISLNYWLINFPSRHSPPSVQFSRSVVANSLQSRGLQPQGQIVKNAGVVRLGATSPVLPVGTVPEKAKGDSSVPDELLLTFSAASLCQGLGFLTAVSASMGVGGPVASYGLLNMATLCKGCSSLYGHSQWQPRDQHLKVSYEFPPILRKAGYLQQRNLFYSIIHQSYNKNFLWNKS